MTVKPGIYRHYKGQQYQVFGVARHSETEQWLVVYRCLYGDYSWWTRPLDMFTEQVSVAGESVARFEFVSGAPGLDELAGPPA
ncbi:DUF1653 domain-containing protein [Simiduia sp. 21SJ11W-1]|uniref:DUF1653 domain-containing protein n=1 Tax=Simiduia sp. 21SJ11W-1 TaxID=2909669 RepID=UPI00209D1200|nr:DUF1653 domain-containing protein [Simiduia sp. 21SJ11W-1]UTA46635.1 DUF1653 domain-containing protein [Simiduia sp. 21SJ11W-1]